MGRERSPATIQLNKAALSHAPGLLRSGDVVHDDRDAWSEHAPSTDQENAFIEKHGMAEYVRWHLGEHPSVTEGTKGRYSFPFGDFTKLHRCAGSPAGAARGSTTTVRSRRL